MFWIKKSKSLNFRFLGFESENSNNLHLHIQRVYVGDFNDFIFEIPIFFILKSKEISYEVQKNYTFKIQKVLILRNQRVLNWGIKEFKSFDS